jgi:hypothetical protein
MVTIGTFFKKGSATYQVFNISPDGHTASAVDRAGNFVEVPYNSLVVLAD